LAGIFAVGLSVLAVKAAGPGKGESAFTRTTIGVGIVVSDVERSVRFYKEALGFMEVGRFEVPDKMAKATGLEEGSQGGCWR